MANRLTTAVDGNTLTATVWNNEFDNIYTGTIDRSAGRWGNNDDIPVVFGNSQDVSITFNTTQTQDCLVIGVDNVSRTIIICEEADKATNFGYAAQTDPLLLVHSSDATVAGDYIGLYHNQTNGYITVGAGALILNPTTPKVFLGDTEDANITTGICINQGASDDGILSFKSSDVAHGVTTLIETDTYAIFKKSSATAGGMITQGYSEDIIALSYAAIYTNGDTGKTTAADAAFIFSAQKKSGTTVGAMGADENIAVFRNLNTTAFILDAEGSSHQDVGTAWTEFDDYDDIALLNSLNAGLARKGDPLKENFRSLLEEHRSTFEKHKILSFNDGPGQNGRPFINWSRTHMLEIGAIRQLAQRLETLERRLLAC